MRSMLKPALKVNVLALEKLTFKIKFHLNIPAQCCTRGQREPSGHA